MRAIPIVFVITLVLILLLGNPMKASAEPSGSQSLSISPYNGFVNLQYQGLDPNSPVTVSASTTGGAVYRYLDLGVGATDASGSGSFLFTPVYAVDRSYTGPLYVRICDKSGNCIRYTIIIGGSHPAIVANPQITGICRTLRDVYFAPPVDGFTNYLLSNLGENKVAQLAFQCGFSGEEVDFLLHKVFLSCSLCNPSKQ